MNSPNPSSPESLHGAAVGSRADFYVPKFLAFDQPGAARTSWNWPAFFVSFYWFLYRRMWREWAVYALVIPVLIAIATLLLPRQGPVLVVAQLLSLAYSFVVVPLFANYLYYGAIKRRIAAVQGRVAEGANQVSVPAALPHTSGLAWLGSISIHYRDSAAFVIAHQTLSLRPGVDAAGNVVWTRGYAADAAADPPGGGAGTNRTSLKPLHLPLGCRK